MAAEGSGGVQSVHLAINVLEAVAFSDDELGVTQIADRLKVTKGSVHRHLTTMVERGYLSQNPATSRYTIGPKSRLLARLSPDTDLVKVAEGPMRELRDALGQTAVLSEMTPRGAMVLVTLPGTSPIEIGVRPGSELPFYNSAQGKVLLAYAPRPFQMRMLRGPFEKVTTKTVVAPDRLDKSLQDIIKRGYGAAPEESMLGINAVAVPIFDANDACVAALAVVGSIQYLPEKAKPADIAALMHAAEQISRKLGHGSGAPFAAVRHRSQSGR